MGKLKTHKGAAKRFKLTATGKVKRHKAYKRHILTKKSRKRKRKLRQGTICFEGDARNIRQMIAGAA